MLHHAVPPQLSREVCTSEGGNQNQDRTPGKKQPEQTTAQPRDKPLPFVHFCATKTQNSIPEENPENPKSTKMCRFTRTSQFARMSSIVQHMEFSPNVDSSTLKGPVCCGSTIACPCCRRDHWSCVRSSCPPYCVGWARIACQR